MIEHEKHFDKEQLFGYAQHFLEGREESEMREHVDRCVACRQTVTEFQRLDAVLDEWKPVAPSTWFDARVRAMVSRDDSARSGFTLFGMRWAQFLAPACMLLLVTVASLIISRANRTNPPHRSAQMVSQPAKTPAARVEEELTLYKDLPVLEDQDYDMLANFDVLSELPRGENKLAN